ncbi:hypothetical protein ABWH93_03805 [Seohaeicola saemankumensis]
MTTCQPSAWGGCARAKYTSTPPSTTRTVIAMTRLAPVADTVAKTSCCI